MVEHLDKDMLLELREVMEEEFPSLIQTYLIDSSDRLDQLQTAINSSEWQNVLSIAHGFKGSSVNIGANQLSILCQEIEQCAKGENQDQLNDRFERLTEEFETVKDALEPMAS